MFIVLNAVKPVNGFRSRRKQKKVLKSSEPVAHSTENGLPFYTLDILDEKGGINRFEAEEKCGRYVSRIVAPRSLALPDNGRIKRFTPVNSNGLFLLNTVIETLSVISLHPEEICITLLDRNAYMNGEISRLLPCASTTRVITSRPEKYVNACSRIYEDCGASVIVRPLYQPVSKKEIIICCDGATTEEMRNSAVFSFRRGIHGMLRFFSEGIELSEKHREFIPESIDSVDFASAVTELCGSTEYKSSRFSQTEVRCSLCEDKNAKKCLECYLSCSFERQ